VVVDCGNGAAGEAAPRLLRKLGCERLLGCVDFGTVIAVNSPGKTHSASGIDTFVLEPGFPDELR